MLFYVQDERYVMMPGMARNDDVQDERYVMMPGMARNDDVQDERYVVMPGMARNDDVQDERSVFLFQTKTKYLHPCRQCHDARDGKE